MVQPKKVTNRSIRCSAVSVYSQWYPELREIEFLRLGWGSRIDYQVQISVNVFFEEVEAVTGKPVIDTLSMMADAVSVVLQGIE
jgi:hypothetical protein